MTRSKLAELDPNHGDRTRTVSAGNTSKNLSEAQSASHQNIAEDEHDISGAPPKKKWKRLDNKKWARLGGKVGRLSFVLELPPETFKEVLSYLQPADILSLSYVNKDLRAKLTAPAANDIWATARMNLPGLPECPPDFTESAYARFLFWKTCELCGGKAVLRKGINMAWIRVRLCTRCTKERCVEGHALFKYFHNMSWHDDYLLRWWLPHESTTQGRRGELYFVPAAVALAKRLANYTDAELLQQHKDERKEFIDRVKAHSKRLDVWLSSFRDDADRDSKAAKESRLQAIRSKLIELGHDQQDMANEEFLQHRHVNQTAPLSKKSWSLVRGHLEEVIEKYKTARLLKAILSRNTPLITGHFRTLFDALPSKSEKMAFPPLPDLLKLPTVQALLCRDEDTNTISAAFWTSVAAINGDIQTFQSRMALDVEEAWRKGLSLRRNRGPSDTATEHAVGHAASPIVSTSTAPDQAHLAATIFACATARCYEPLHYPSFLHHSHEKDAKTARLTLRRLPWEGYLRRLDVTKRSRKVMASILSAASLEEGTATVHDLDAIGRHFSFSPSTAESDGGSCAPMTWRAVYRSIMSDGDHDPEKVLDPFEAAFWDRYPAMREDSSSFFDDLFELLDANTSPAEDVPLPLVTLVRS